jgi:hypothetical protein
LTVAWVPTGIKTGVWKIPCPVRTSPRRAAQVVERQCKVKGEELVISCHSFSKKVSWNLFFAPRIFIMLFFFFGISSDMPAIFRTTRC